MEGNSIKLSASATPRLLAGKKVFYGVNGHFDYPQTPAVIIANMKHCNMNVYRITWEGDSTSMNKIVAMAAAFQANNTGAASDVYLYVTLDVSTLDINNGNVTFTSEPLAFTYGQTSGNTVATALLPYISVIMGLGCGNEMTGKDSIKLNAAYMGTTPSDFSNAKWPILRGVLRGTAAGIRAVGAFKVGSNASIFAEKAALDMLWFGTQPDGSTGYPTFRWDITDCHSYHAWNDPFNSPYDGPGTPPHFNFWAYCNATYGVPLITSEFNGDANSQTDLAMRAWVDKIMFQSFKARLELNIACIMYYEMFDTDFAWGMLETSTNAPRVTRGQAICNFIRQYPDDIDGSTFNPIRNAAMQVFAKYPGQFNVWLPKEQSYSESAATNKVVTNAAIVTLQDLAGFPERGFWQNTNPPGLVTADGSATFSTASSMQILGTGALYATVGNDSAFIIGCQPSGTGRQMAIFAPATSGATAKYARAGSIASTATTVYANWTSDTPTDYRASYTFTDTFTTARVLTSRKVGTSGTLRVNGAVKATVALTAFTAATLNTAYIGKEYFDDTNTYTGKVWCAISCNGTIADADLLILEQWVNSLTPTGVTIGSVADSSGSSPVVIPTQTFTASTNGTSVPASGTNLIEADTVSSDATRIFSNGVDFALNIVTRATAADTLNYTIYDAEDVVAATGSFAVPATPRTTALKINSTKAGYFRIKCNLTTAGGAIATVGSQPAGFCTFGVKTALTSVLPAPTYVHQDQHRFGIQGFNDNGPTLRALGVTQCLDDRDWSTMEPSTDGTFVASAANGDQFYYTNTDIMRLVRGDGVPDRYLSGPHAGQRDSWAPSNLTNFQAYWAKVGTETERLRGTYYPTQAKNYYQPTWEPDVSWLDTDANFIAMQTAFYNGVHSTDPNAIVMGPTDSFITATNARLVRLAGISTVYGAHVDGISTHGYWDAGTFPSHRPEQRGASTDAPTALNGMAQAYNTLRTTMATIRTGMKLFQTEMGVGYEFAYNYGNVGINANYLYAHGATVAVGATISLGEGVDVHYPFFGGDFTQESNGSAGYGVFFTLDPVQTADFAIPHISPKPAAMALHAAIAVLDGTTTLGRDTTFSPADNGIHAYWFQRIGGGKCILEAHTFKDASWQLGAFSNTYTRNATFKVDATGTSGTVPVIDWQGNVTTIAYTNGQITLALKQHPQYVIVSNITIAKSQATAPVGYTAVN